MLMQLAVCFMEAQPPSYPGCALLAYTILFLALSPQLRLFGMFSANACQHSS